MNHTDTRNRPNLQDLRILLFLEFANRLELTRSNIAGGLTRQQSTATKGSFVCNNTLYVNTVACLPLLIIIVATSYHVNITPPPPLNHAQRRGRRGSEEFEHSGGFVLRCFQTMVIRRNDWTHVTRG